MEPTKCVPTVFLLLLYLFSLIFSAVAICFFNAATKSTGSWIVHGVMARDRLEKPRWDDVNVSQGCGAVFWWIEEEVGVGVRVRGS